MSDEKYSLQEMDTDEESLSFSSGVEDQACIGHLRGDFGEGTEFWTSWWDHHKELKGQEFKDELNDLVNALRKDGPLKDLSSMERFCWSHLQARMSVNSGLDYYFRTTRSEVICAMFCGCRRLRRRAKRLKSNVLYPNF